MFGLCGNRRCVCGGVCVVVCVCVLMLAIKVEKAVFSIISSRVDAKAAPSNNYVTKILLFL